jgi:peptidoglycan/xylan/chitin deacetylase (PgdA/CDA1 family)
LGILRQEGTSVRSNAGADTSGLSALILDSLPGATDAARIRRFVEDGGGALCSAREAAAVMPELRAQECELRWIAPDAKSALFHNVGVIDLHARGWQMAGADAGITDGGNPAILATQRGRGWFIVLPFDLPTVLSDTSSGPRRFWADAPRFPYDTVARVSRGDVRRLVANCLRFLLSRAGLPYVHLSSVPGDDGSAFGFRVDTDFGPLANLEATAGLASRTGMKFSWYVNTRSHGQHLPVFKRYSDRGQDIQLHCYRHTVYPDLARNRDNFAKGKTLMLEAGLVPVGVVAPYGEWNPNLDRAFTELGFEYSSEFCHAYDDTPSRPVVESPVSNVQRPASSVVLQIPVHPVCLGRLVAARATTGQMLAYYRRVIDLAVARAEPCFIYDHPERVAQHEGLLEQVLKYGKERCRKLLTLTEYARWWQGRERASFTVRPNQRGLGLEGEARADVLLTIEQTDRFARVPVTPSRIEYDKLTWRSSPARVRFNRECLKAVSPNLRVLASDRLRRLRKTLQGRRS